MAIKIKSISHQLVAGKDQINGNHSPTKAQILNRPLGLMLLSRLDWPLFLLSAHWIGVASTAIIWGIKPIMSIIFLRRLVFEADGQRRYLALARTAWPWPKPARQKMMVDPFGTRGLKVCGHQGFKDQQLCASA